MKKWNTNIQLGIYASAKGTPKILRQKFVQHHMFYSISLTKFLCYLGVNLKKVSMKKLHKLDPICIKFYWDVEKYSKIDENPKIIFLFAVITKLLILVYFVNLLLFF